MKSLAKHKKNWIVFLLCIFVQSMSAQVSFKNEIKRDLLKSIKPITTSPRTNLTTSPLKNDVLETNVLKSYKKVNGNPEIFIDEDADLQINPNLYTNTTNKPFTTPIPGNTRTVYDGGHFTQELVGTVKGPSITLDLSGGGPRLISKESRKILKHVYGVNVDDHGNGIVKK